MMRSPVRRGHSLIGLLVAVACMLILSVVLMTALDKAVTGEGSAKVNTLHSFEDKLALTAMMQAMIVHANDNDGWYVVPSQIARSNDRSLDTTANFWSAMIALRYVRPETLVSGNEYSGFVEACLDSERKRWATEQALTRLQVQIRGGDTERLIDIPQALAPRMSRSIRAA